MAAVKQAGGAKAPTGKVKTPSPLVGEGGLRQLRVGGEGGKSEVLNMVSVTVKKPHTRRWRAGMCFTAEPRVESVTLEVLAQLQADPLLVVDEAFTPPSQPLTPPSQPLTPPSQPSPIEGEGVNSQSPIEGEGDLTPSPLVGAGANSPSPLRGRSGSRCPATLGGVGEGVDLAQGATQAPTTEG